MKRRKIDSKTNIATIAVISTVLFFTLSAVPTIAMDESGVPEKLVVGTIFSPPFAMNRKIIEHWIGINRLEVMQQLGVTL
jgi:hypothetical protein